eukprot:755646-Hanusia_phi.AAC.4
MDMLPQVAPDRPAGSALKAGADQDDNISLRKLLLALEVVLCRCSEAMRLAATDSQGDREHRQGHACRDDPEAGLRRGARQHPEPSRRCERACRRGRSPPAAPRPCVSRAALCRG